MNTEQFLDKYQKDGDFLDMKDVKALLECVQAAKANRQNFKKAKAKKTYFSYSVIALYLNITALFFCLDFIYGLGLEKFTYEDKTNLFTVLSLLSLCCISIHVHLKLKEAGLNPWKYSLLPGGLAILFDKGIITDYFHFQYLKKTHDNTDENNARKYSVIKAKGQIPYAIVDRFAGCDRTSLVQLLKVQFKEVNTELYDARQRDFDKWFNSVNNGATHNWDNLIS